MLVTDTHAHIYSEDETRYPMIEKPYRPPAGTGTVAHLKRTMAENGVRRAVAIQTSSTYRFDNRFLADAARENGPWMVGVCTLDPLNAESPKVLRTLVENSNVRGMRSLPAETTPPQLDHPGVDALWSTAEQLGVPINPLIGLEFADELKRLVQRHPKLSVVLDHCMGAGARWGVDGPDMRRFLALAAYPNVYAKLTLLIAGSETDYPFQDTYPIIRAIVDAFTPGRCVWGSDFPCELWTPKGTYAQHLTLFTNALDLSDVEKEAILSRTPGRLWFGER